MLSGLGVSGPIGASELVSSQDGVGVLVGQPRRPFGSDEYAQDLNWLVDVLGPGSRLRRALLSPSCLPAT
jgi:hypothetical protein